MRSRQEALGASQDLPPVAPLVRCTLVLRAETVGSCPCVPRPFSPPTAGLASAPLREQSGPEAWQCPSARSSRESLPRSALPVHRPTPLSAARLEPRLLPFLTLSSSPPAEAVVTAATNAVVLAARSSPRPELSQATQPHTPASWLKEGC